MGCPDINRIRVLVPSTQVPSLDTVTDNSSTLPGLVTMDTPSAQPLLWGDLHNTTGTWDCK